MSGPWLILIGAAAGVFAGLFGIGGGIIIVPSLILLAGFPLVKATGTSLAAILLPVGILGVVAYYRAKIIDLRASAFLAAGLLTSVVVGAWLANTLPVELMRRFFAVFCLYVGWNFIDPVRRFRKWRGLKVESKPEPDALPHPSPWPLLGIGVLAGVMAGHVRHRRRQHHRAAADAGPPLPAEDGPSPRRSGPSSFPSASPACFIISGPGTST